MQKGACLSADSSLQGGEQITPLRISQTAYPGRHTDSEATSMTTPTDLNSIANDAAALPETFNAGELTFIAGAAFSLPIAPTPLVVTFCATDGTRAQLTVNKGRVTFEGNPDAAAEMFIEVVTRKHAQQWSAAGAAGGSRSPADGVLSPQWSDDALTAAGGRREGTRRAASRD